MRGAAHTGGEDLDGDEERGDIGADVQEELGEGEEGHEPAGGCVVGDAGPDGVEDGDGETGVELLVDAADPVGEEDADVVAWEEALRVYVRNRSIV